MSTSTKPKGRLALGFLSFLLLFVAMGANAFALKFIFESYASLETQKAEFTGEIAGEQMGAVVAVGDFDNDGVEDIASGSPFASLNNKQWNGSVKILFGSTAKGIQTNYLIFFGENSGDQFGTSLAVGDFNNDSYDDLAIGAYNAQSNSIDRAGKVYIVYGTQNLRSQTSKRLAIQQSELGSTLRIDRLAGGMDGDQFGLSLFAMDANNDGMKDLLIGAPLASGPEFNRSGAVYLYHGSQAGISLNANRVFYAQEYKEKFGSTISGGHIISQAQNDLVVGAYNANVGKKKQAGKVYIFTDGSSVKSISGYIEKGWFGFTLDAGDVNGDGYDDLAIATFPYKAERSDARISIFYGGKAVFKKFPNVVIDSPAGETFPGGSLALKDLNNDGKADVLIGAPGIASGKSMEEGRVYILNGSETLSSHYSLVDNDYDVVIHGENYDDWFGSALAMIDFNKDGYKDIVIGSRYSDGKESVDNGKVFLFYGDGKAYGKLRTLLESDDKKVSRGELVNITVERLEIKEKNKDFIDSCLSHREFCFFNFLAMSSYDKIKLTPKLILYPDVSPDSSYYENVNVATMLGLVNGFMNETNTPFHPELPVKRIEALKVVFGAADLVESKYQFELVAALGSYEKLLEQKTPFSDINAKIPSMWWYPRYVNFAVEHNIVDRAEYFRPNEDITEKELDDIISRTTKYLKEKSKNEKINSQRDS